MEVRLPSDYISSSTERISLYTELDHIDTEEGLKRFTDNLIDRFGPLPKQGNDLLNTVRLRWEAKKLGFEKIMLRNNVMSAYFVSNQESKYYEGATHKRNLDKWMNFSKRY